MNLSIKVAIFAAIFCSACGIQALAANEWLTGIKIVHCNEKHFCSELKTKYAQRGTLDSLYAFGNATLKVTVESYEGKINETVWTGQDGYYDPDKQRVVLRGIQNKNYSEVVLNMNEGKFIYF